MKAQPSNPQTHSTPHSHINHKAPGHLCCCPQQQDPPPQHVQLRLSMLDHYLPPAITAWKDAGLDASPPPPPTTTTTQHYSSLTHMHSRGLLMLAGLRRAAALNPGAAGMQNPADPHSHPSAQEVRRAWYQWIQLRNQPHTGRPLTQPV
jgi:hypothetical protein